MVEYYRKPVLTIFCKPTNTFSLSICYLLFPKDLQMKPYRTDEYVHRLYYETSRFSAFNHQWVVKAIINKSQRDPHQSCERDINYQVSTSYITDPTNKT